MVSDQVEAAYAAEPMDPDLVAAIESTGGKGTGEPTKTVAEASAEETEKRLDARIRQVQAL